MLSNMKIATRIGLGFGSIILLILGMGIFAMLQMAKVNEASTEIATSWLPNRVLATEDVGVLTRATASTAAFSA